MDVDASSDKGENVMNEPNPLSSHLAISKVVSCASNPPKSPSSNATTNSNDMVVVANPFRLNNKKNRKRNNPKPEQKKKKKVKKSMEVETIRLSSSEEENDEVVYVPLPPEEILILDDSDEEDKANLSKLHINNNNSNMSNDTFLKPLSRSNSVERRFENSSCCTSPSSIISYDDFILQNDRQRAKKIVNPDEIFFAGIDDSLTEPPIQMHAKERCLEEVTKKLDPSNENGEEKNQSSIPAGMSISLNRPLVVPNTLNIYDSDSDRSEVNKEISERNLLINVAKLKTKSKKARKSLDNKLTENLDESVMEETPSEKNSSFDETVVNPCSKRSRRKSKSDKTSTDVAGDQPNEDNSFFAKLRLLAEGNDKDEEKDDKEVDSIFQQINSNKKNTENKVQETFDLADEEEDAGIVDNIQKLDTTSDEEKVEASDERDTMENNSPEVVNLVEEALPYLESIEPQLRQMDEILKHLDNGPNRYKESVDLTEVEKDDDDSLSHLILATEDQSMPVPPPPPSFPKSFIKNTLRKKDLGAKTNNSILESKTMPASSENSKESEANEIINIEDDCPTASSPVKAVPIKDQPNANAESITAILSKMMRTNKKSPTEEAKTKNPEKPPAEKKSSNKSNHYAELSHKDTMSPSGLGWCEEQKRFYNNSWGGEDFNLDKTLSKMNSDRRIWKIDASDLARVARRKKEQQMKCFNCSTYGHRKAGCPLPFKPPICRVCGEQGHYETTCPNKCCLRCGAKTKSFFKTCNSCSFQSREKCSICKFIGHNSDNCPDRWRRYHSTTKNSEKLKQHPALKQKSFCSNCGKSGHFIEYCRRDKMPREYAAVSSRVTSYERSYELNTETNKQKGLICSLLYAPQKFEFKDKCLLNPAQKSPLYSRILNSIGLSHILKGKRPHPDSSNNSITLLQKKAKLNDNENNQRAKEKQGAEISTTSSENSLPAEPAFQPYVSPFLSLPVNLPNSSLKRKACTRTSTLSKEEWLKSVEAAGESLKESSPSAAHDSDSSYSFSDHFETNEDSPSTSSLSTLKPSHKRPMGPTPEFIPIANHTDEDSDMFPSDPEPSLSRAVENAKILLTSHHAAFLKSENGNSLLRQITSDMEIETKLEPSIAGPMLLLKGPSNNLEPFQNLLQESFKKFADDSKGANNIDASLQLPKKVGALIRFLRDDLGLLKTKIGYVFEIYKRLVAFENQVDHSKGNVRMMNKLKRNLNMILIGQAGLENGKTHVQTIFNILEDLVRNYSQDAKVPFHLRNKLFTHWKMTFTPYKYPNYAELLDQYKHLDIKNHYVTMKLDPIILGERVLNISLNPHQIEKMNATPSNAPANKNNPTNSSTSTSAALLPDKNQTNQKQRALPGQQQESSLPPIPPLMNVPLVNNSNTLSNLNTNQMPPNMGPASSGTSTSSSSIQINAFCDPNSNSRKKSRTSNDHIPPFLNPEQRSNIPSNIYLAHREWENLCQQALSNIERGAGTRSNKLPSVYWSRESAFFIDKLINMVGFNPTLINALKRLRSKASDHQLNVDDFMSIKKVFMTAQNQKC